MAQKKLKNMENKFWNKGLSIAVEYLIYDILVGPR